MIHYFVASEEKSFLAKLSYLPRSFTALIQICQTLKSHLLPSTSLSHVTLNYIDQSAERKWRVLPGNQIRWKRWWMRVWYIKVWK